MCRNPEIRCALDDLLRNGKPHIRVFGNPRVVVRDRHNGHVVFLDQRQHHLKPLLLTGHGVQKRAAFRGGQAIFQGTRHGTVNAERAIGDGLYTLYEFFHQRGFDEIVVRIARVFGHFVRKHRARVDVKYIGPCRNLRKRIRLHARKITALQFLVQDLATRGVDALANHTERLIKSDDRSFGFGFDDSTGHAAAPS